VGIMGEKLGGAAFDLHIQKKKGKNFFPYIFLETT
jgi:hypothetical protein